MRVEELRQGKAELKTEYEIIDFLMERLKNELYVGENLERQLQCHKYLSINLIFHKVLKHNWCGHLLVSWIFSSSSYHGLENFTSPL